MFTNFVLKTKHCFIILIAIMIVVISVLTLELRTTVISMKMNQLKSLKLAPHTMNMNQSRTLELAPHTMKMNKSSAHELAQPIEQIRMNSCKDCFHLDFKVILNEQTFCNESDIDILILITSHPQHKTARNVIRGTWGEVCRRSKSKLKCLFVLGNARDDILNKEMKNESHINHDMLQIDFNDSYANLTYKTMLALKWASEHCSHAKYVMKTDDDMYVNTELLPLLTNQTRGEHFFGGFCWGPASPNRDKKSKWYVARNIYKGERFPSVCSGTGYLISTELISRIVAISQTLHYFYLEDVFVALCLNNLGVRPTSITGFSNLFVRYDRCKYKNSVITSHEIKPEKLRQIWEDSRLCETPIPSSMTFKFQVLP